MRTIVLDMQSALYAKALRRSLTQELEDCNVVISGSPRDTVSECRAVKPYALLMEVTEYSPWTITERLALRDSVKSGVPECRIVFIVDESNRALAAQVTRAKQDGLIDAFLFSSASESYLAAVLDSL